MLKLKDLIWKNLLFKKCDDQMEEAEQYCFEDYESDRAVASQNGTIVDDNGSKKPRSRNKGKSKANLRRNSSEEHEEKRVGGVDLHGFDGQGRESSDHYRKVFNSRGELIPGLGLANSGVSKKGRYLKNANKKQRDWRKPKLFAKSNYLHRTMSDGDPISGEEGGMGDEMGMFPGSIGNLESKSVEERLQHLSREDRLSVRTRPDLIPGKRAWVDPRRQNTNNSKSGDSLDQVHLLRPGDGLDHGHPSFLIGSSLDNILPVDDRLPGINGHSLPSEMDRIALFAPRDLIASQGSLSSHRETDEELSAESSRSNDSLAPITGNRLKRRPLPDAPDPVDTLLGRNPRERLMEARMNLNGKLAARGHRTVTRSNTAPSTSLLKEAECAKLDEPEVRAPMLSISNKESFIHRGEFPPAVGCPGIRLVAAEEWMRLEEEGGERREASTVDPVDVA